MDQDKQRFQSTIQNIDRENSQDPNLEIFEGNPYPKELLYAQRMTEWLAKIAPDASEELQLAARSQHICRWSIPRNSYEMNKKGYLLWRTRLKTFHAKKTADIMLQSGYGEEQIKRVQSLILKEKIKLDKESQILEDVVCLVFLENYFQGFSQKHSSQKIIEIIKKTWRKMSNKAHLEALKLQLKPDAQDLISQAIDN